MQLIGQLVKLKKMEKNKILIFGYGYCAKALVAKLINKKNEILVVSRNKQNIDKLKDADREIYPASMTKIMTSIIAFDLIKSGDLELDDKINISDFVIYCDYNEVSMTDKRLLISCSFGTAPRAHMDDALRGVLASLRMSADIETNSKLRHYWRKFM